MAPPQAIQILGQIKDTSVQARLLVGAVIWLNAPRVDRYVHFSGSIFVCEID